MGIIQQFLTSLGRFDDYHKLARLGPGRSFVFLLAFMLAVSVVCGLKYASLINRIVETVAASSPNFVLYGGTLKVFGPMPLVREYGTTLVVDTTGRITPEEFLTAYGQGAFIGADRMIVKQAGRTEVVFWKDLNPAGQVWTRDNLVELLEGIKPWRFLAIPVYFLSKLFTKLFHVLILSLLALIAGTALRSRYSYAELWNISLYAMVPVTVAETLKTAVGLTVPFWRGVYWLAALAIVVLVLVKLRRRLSQDEPAGDIVRATGGSEGDLAPGPPAY